MDFRRISLVLYILFIFHLQDNLLFVSSRPPSVDTNHETLPLNPSVTDDVVGFEGKTRELAVVIKKIIWWRRTWRRQWQQGNRRRSSKPITWRGRCDLSGRIAFSSFKR
ncbi:Uncharacterized protein Rs2_50853 [Raphanus sativus]|nr:Uncharacterized protein Rs2_50853 [Raphanus sativus]